MSNQNRRCGFSFQSLFNMEQRLQPPRRVPYTKQCVCGRVSAPDPARGAYSVPLDLRGPLRGEYGKGGKKGKRKGMKRGGKIKTEREGRNTNYTIEINF